MSALHERQWAAALIVFVAAWVVIRIRNAAHLRHQRELEQFRIHVRIYTIKEPKC